MKTKNYLLQMWIFLILQIFILSVIPMSAAAESGNCYYVATDGVDTNDGSISAPFATITHAASVMQAGDTCFIRGGTYREAVTISGKRELSFKAYGNEKVTISGGKLISGWDVYKDNIYVADTSIDIYSGKGNMLFVDGNLQTEARWPNAGVSEWLDRTKYAVADGPYRYEVSGVDVRYIKDAAIGTELSGVDLTGAMLWCATGDAYWSYMAEITEHDISANTLHLDKNAFHDGYKTVKDNFYYITRHLALLDGEGEWYLDTENDKIYFMAPGKVDPDTLNVELRAREYAIKVTNSSYIDFVGVDVYGALVEFSSSTSNCSFENGKLEALDYKIPGGEWNGTSRGYGQGASQGFVINGSNNKLSGCEVKNMFGEGITLKGSSNKVVNNYIHDINFEHTYSDGIYITGKNHLVTRNTVENTGRGTVGGSFDECVISYNKLSDASKLSTDTGVVYFNAHDYKNSEIHHNIIRGNDLSEASDLQLGLYLDSFTTSLIIYNNLIYDMETETPNQRKRSLCFNPNSFNNVFANNTFVNSYPAIFWEGHDFSGSIFVNNLFRSAAFVYGETIEASGIVYEHNLEGVCVVNAENEKVIDTFEPKDYWTDAENDDYTLADSSEAIDAGVYVPGISEGYTGDAPDCGALEYGTEPWTAGHDFTKTFDDTFKLNTKIPFRNLVQNRGFESSLTSGWTISGAAARVGSDSWGTYGSYTKDGTNAIKLKSESDSLTQTVSGLKPYTSYDFGMHAFLAGSFTRYAPGGTVTSKKTLSDGENLCFENVDFGSGAYDKMYLRLLYPHDGDKIDVRLDSEDGEIIARVTLSEWEDSLIGWEWVSADVSAVSGVHTVYLCPSGDNFASTSFAGFHLIDSDASDSIVLTATSDSGETKSLEIKSAYFDVPAPTVSIMTGKSGSITLKLSKKGNSMSGYADYVQLCEVPAAVTGEMADIVTVNDILVTDGEGNPRYGIGKGKVHNVKATLANTSGKAQSYRVRLMSYDAENLGDVSEAQSLVLAEGGSGEVSLKITAALSDNAALTLLVVDSDGKSVTMEIDDEALEAQYTGDGVFVKDTAVRDISGVLRENMKAGEFNIFEITLKNSQNTEKPLLGILALYDEDGRLCEILRMTYEVGANERGGFVLGAVLTDNAKTAKLFAWENMTELVPIIQNEEFEITAAD